MKKIILAAAALMLCITPLMAQTVKVNKDEILKKIAKSDEDIANSKKNTKVATWIERGKIYTEAGSAASTGLYHPSTGMSMPTATLTLLFGNSESTSKKTVGGVEYDVWSYPNFDAYILDGNLMFWDSKLVIAENAFDEAYNAYRKAYSLDDRAGDRLIPLINDIANEMKKEVTNYFGLQELGKAADALAKVYEYQVKPPVNVVDTLSLYNAGMLYASSGEFEKGRKALEKCLEYDYERDGDTYYYLYHCYFADNQVEKAKEILERGVELYPGNSGIVEGLINVYTSLDADPRDIIQFVRKAIENDPENSLLWNGLGNIYLKLEDYPEAIKAFEQALSIAPDDFFNNLHLGFTYITMADKMYAALAASPVTSQSNYNAELERINDIYAKSIAPLEKAFSADPNHALTLELLKNVTFRLRDRDSSIMDKYNKYNKYNEIYKNMQ